jgi:putative ABC transport system permease protein
VVNGILLRPFPYRDPERLVVLWERNQGKGFPRMFVSPPNFQDWARESRSFESIAAYTEEELTLETDFPERVSGTAVTASLFSLLGVEPIQGRAFLPEEDREGAPRVVVVSHGFWQRRLGGDPGAVGRTVILDSEPHTLVGVMPPGFSFPPPIALEGNLSVKPSEIWIPLRLDYASGQRGAHYLTVVGRLAAGVPIEEAQAELQQTASALRAAHAENQGWDAHAVPLAEEVTGNMRRALLVLTAAVGLVLLVACANVAGLLLGRGLERAREMAVRASLGAGRARLVRQVLAESLLLAFVSGALGILLALAFVRAVIAFGPGNLPRLTEVSLDGRAAVAATAICLASGILLGLVPALRLSAVDGFEGLKSRDGARSRSSTARSVLVISEVALALPLLVGAGLLARSFSNLRTVDPGFRTTNTLMFSTQLPRVRYGEVPARARFLEESLSKLEALSGVASVGAVNELPLAHDRQGTSFYVEGEERPPQGQEPHTAFAVVSPGYFETLGVPLVIGRVFDEGDRIESSPVVVVNQAFVRRYFGNADPIGKRISLGMSLQTSREIVGIVGDVRHQAIATEAVPNVYAPYLQYPRSLGLTFVVETEMSPEALLSPVRQALSQVDPALPLFDLRSLTQVVDESISQSRFESGFFSLFSLAALLLAAVGLYGLVSYSVSRRIPEIGLRMALGADASSVRNLVVGEGARLALLGLGLGLFGSIALTRFLSSLLFGVGALDPATFALAILVLFVAALSAAYLPARRAMRVAPIEALRYE